MSSEKITEDTITTPPAKNAPSLVKKIGQTTYIVRVHFSRTSKETMDDKLTILYEIFPKALLR